MASSDKKYAHQKKDNHTLGRGYHKKYLTTPKQWQELSANAVQGELHPRSDKLIRLAQKVNSPVGASACARSH